MKLFGSLSIFLIFFSFLGQAQTRDSSTAAGTKPFKTTGGKKFWMGSNYRTEWNTVVSAPRINLATQYGGLKPTKRGGGKQTKSLRLEDPQGREYNLRSIQKFITSKTLPGDLQSEAAADIVADGISASYPYSALSIGPLADAAGIAHLDAKLVYIPDDPLLGEYRADFGNMLALFEKKLPDSVKKGWDTEEVVEKMLDDNDNDLDQVRLLKVRILDMFVMDLDRHEGQWEWGAWDNGKGKTYYPIAKDRDQAFYVNQGVLPGIVKWPWLVPQLQGFRAESKNIKRFNFAARNLDRYFLNELNEADWKRVTEEFISEMTDAVIDNAINQQPPEIRNISGDKIKQTLKARRANLLDEVMEYYHFLAEVVDVSGSDKTELIDVTHNDDGSAHVQIFKITKEGEQSIKMFDRRFDANETDEIRLYGMGGNDKFVVKGSNDKIKVRLIGGAGEDAFDNTSSGKPVLYDATGENSKLTGSFKNKISGDSLVNNYDLLGYKYNQAIPFVSIGFNQDDGLFLGASLKLIRHGFRKDPYKNLHQFEFSTALGTQAYNFRFYSEYIGVFGKKTDLLFDADIKAPNNTTNFFGYGMGTIFDKSSPDGFRYYRARYNTGDITLMARTNITPQFRIQYGPTFQFFSLDPADKFNSVRYITQTALNGLDPATLYEKQSYIGGVFSLIVDTRNNPVMPKGINWITTARHLSEMKDIDYQVTQLNSELTVYMNLIPKVLQIANRVGGGHNFGDFEFYQAQYLGNENHLRGFRKYRFAGRSKAFNNTEIRWAAAKFNTYLFPGSLGFLAFYDVGRVWADNDNSNKWQSGYGLGFWIAPLNRLLINFTFTASNEDKLPLVALKWKF